MCVCANECVRAFVCVVQIMCLSLITLSQVGLCVLMSVCVHSCVQCTCVCLSRLCVSHYKCAYVCPYVGVNGGITLAVEHMIAKLEQNSNWSSVSAAYKHVCAQSLLPLKVKELHVAGNLIAYNL